MYFVSHGLIKDVFCISWISRDIFTLLISQISGLETALPKSILKRKLHFRCKKFQVEYKTFPNLPAQTQTPIREATCQDAMES